MEEYKYLGCVGDEYLSNVRMVYEYAASEMGSIEERN